MLVASADAGLMTFGFQTTCEAIQRNQSKGQLNIQTCEDRSRIRRARLSRRRTCIQQFAFHMHRTGGQTSTPTPPASAAICAAGHCQGAAILQRFASAWSAPRKPPYSHLL